eukprot:CAMPEP_0179453302 /NCGR_PEP_ID=MMETSP0799-20121207/37244_1 /TAXON_ID=46947 /ORGANISM="Geminigera cryophila, Strain CCMP2564" /LENGTH=38 /DNA_ID= /DNA_START= /DNA_END= /DNA_ORIENTATION=
MVAVMSSGGSASGGGDGRKEEAVGADLQTDGLTRWKFG